MQPLKIAYRNVLRQGKRTALLGGAIAFGFFIFILLNSFTGGLLSSLSNNFSDALGGHIYVSGSEVSDLGSELNVIRDDALIRDALRVIDEDVASYNTRSSARVSAIFGSRQENVQLDGVDTSQEAAFLDSLVLSGGSREAFLDNPNSVLLPEAVLSDLGTEVGESVILRTSTITGQQNVGEAVIAGSLAEQNLFAPGAPIFAYAHIELVNTLLGAESGQYQSFNIYVNDLGEVDAVTDLLYTELARGAPTEPRAERGGLPDPSDLGFGGVSSVDEDERWAGTKFEVTNVNDRLANINSLVGIINALGFGIFVVILVIIMVGIMNSYRMVMIERTPEIGSMRAMGLHKSGIRNIFIWEALFVAISGVAVGLIAALLVMGGVSLIDLGTSSTFSLFLNEGRIAFDLSLATTLGSALLVCALSAAAVYVPARAAARLQPAEALRVG